VRSDIGISISVFAYQFAKRLNNRRAQAIAFNLLAAWLLFLLAKIYFDNKVAFLSAGLYLWSPYTLIYGQSFMSESMSLCLFMLALYLFSKECTRGSIRLPFIFFSAVAFGVCVTGRLHFAVFLPTFLVCAYGTDAKEKGRTTLFFSVISSIPPLLWYGYTYYLSSEFDNIHTNVFFQLAIGKLGFGNLLFQLAYYQRLFAIISEHMLTPLAFPFFIFGLLLLKRGRANTWLILTGLGCSLFIVVLLPQKVIDHDFYLYGTYPFVVMATAEGISAISNAFGKMNRNRILIPMLFIYLAISARYFLHPIFKFPAEDNQIMHVGKEVQRITKPEDWLVVAGRNASVLFYYLDRPGWPIHFDGKGVRMSQYARRLYIMKNRAKDFDVLAALSMSAASWIEYLREQGASYFIVHPNDYLESQPDLLNYLSDHALKMRVPEDENYLLYRISKAE